uniref:Uncharacterized protein n=1 Tax=Rhizophora mucronata TaxID=61149 RepID=A0A2P2R0S8_RHIMU
MKTLTDHNLRYFSISHLFQRFIFAILSKC